MPASKCPHILSLTLARKHELKLSWLDSLPNAGTLCLALCLKGLQCGAPEVRSSLRKLGSIRLHSCVEEPGGSEWGHEGVCAFRFLLDNYDTPWKGVFFTHADVNTGHHYVQFRLMHAFLQRNEWPAWPDRIEEVTAQHCGCGGSVGTGVEFGPRFFWYKHITWWLGHFVTPTDPAAATGSEEWIAQVGRRALEGAYMHHNGTLYSPDCFMFAVDRASVRSRSRDFYFANYQLNLHGVRVIPEGANTASPGAVRHGNGFNFNPLVWGHVNERLPLFLFNREFRELPQLPRCLFATTLYPDGLPGEVAQGNWSHVMMNCTQTTTAALHTRKTLPKTKHLHAHRDSGHGRQHRARCEDPFENHCGYNSG